MPLPETCFEWIEAHNVDIVSYPRSRTGFRWAVVVHVDEEKYPRRYYANSLDIAIGYAMERFP